MDQGRDRWPVYGGRPVCNDGRPVISLKMWDVGRSSSGGDQATKDDGRPPRDDDKLARDEEKLARDDDEPAIDDWHPVNDGGRRPNDGCPIDDEWKTYAPAASEIDKK